MCVYIINSFCMYNRRGFHIRYMPPATFQCNQCLKQNKRGRGGRNNLSTFRGHGAKQDTYPQPFKVHMLCIIEACSKRNYLCNKRQVRLRQIIKTQQLRSTRIVASSDINLDGVRKLVTSQRMTRRILEELHSKVSLFSRTYKLGANCEYGSLIHLSKLISYL